MIIETFSADETYEYGRKIGSEAQPGDVYCLTGDLGVGKTVFTQGFAAGLGVEEAVSSPTFIILMFTVSAMWKRWMKLVLMIMFTEKESA